MTMMTSSLCPKTGTVFNLLTFKMQDGLSYWTGRRAFVPGVGR